MGHAQHRAFVLFQVLLQPINGLGIQVVGRLVQQQHVRLLEQQPAQGNSAALATAELRDGLVVRGTTQRIHGDAQLGVQFPCIQGIDAVLNLRLAVHELLHFVGIVEDFLIHEFHVDLLVFLQHIHNFLRSLFNDLPDRLGFIQLRFLRQVTHGVTVRPNHLSLVRFVQARDDFHHRGFSCAVVSNDANFGAVEKGQVDVFQNVLAGGGGFVHPNHAKNDLLVFRHVLRLRG